jgi:glycosyltransferase involved in cell wall biosynthesis
MAHLTVLMPSLNAMPYLKEAFASLQMQTYQNFEVLFWDNGSTDGSVEEAQRWIPGKLRGRVVSNNPLPFHLCLAEMVDQCQTKWVARMDADDLISPDRFELQIQQLENDVSLVGVGGQLEAMNPNGTKIEDLPFPLRYHEILSRLLFSSPLPHAAMMMRRDAIVGCGNYQQPPPVEDFDLWFRFLLRGRAVNLKETIYRYRIHQGGITERAKKAEKHTQAIFECLKRNVPDFFGVDKDVLDKLLAKRHAFAFLPMLRVARRISDLSGEKMRTVLGCPDFLFSARCYTAKWDVLSKLVYRIWGRRQKA